MSRKRLIVVIATVLALVIGVTAISVAAVNRKATLNIFVVSSSGEGNDLVETLSANYDGVTVYSSLDLALNNVTDETKGIMVLADNYPNSTTAITDAQAQKINELGVRVYVEYPALNEKLGIVGYDGTGKMDYDRAIVTDADAMGMEIYSILYVHGAQYLKKTDISDSWLVNATVAGYDTVEFYDEETGELTDCTPYSMLEVNDAGNVLIASTRLSQFISGRYAPYARWQSLWMSVISWVSQTDVDDLNLIEWTPVANPNYGPDEELADDAYSEAVRLNTEWFINSGLLISADGSEGIMEGFRSGKGFKVDGAQRIRNSVRADCNGETVAALALAAQLLGNEDYEEIAYNLMDWLLNESELANGVRADEESDQYGLLSWHNGAIDQYYGDDNARAILGLILGASALETDEFDERILEAIMANFRTTGEYGYRGSMIRGENIDLNGWEYYYNRTNKNFAPHFEAMLWACYLWAYDKTGYEPLLERTETGISMMMEAYEETMKGDLDSGSGEWKSTNGIQQERAKMILPLAWLVRVEPTEEHIAWLDLIITDMMEYQDEETGALRDAVAEEGYGIIGLPPFSTNSDYGEAEAPVIQNNGDPCSDSLYTTNFAMLGLNEAYAAMVSVGNSSLASKYLDYSTSLSDYHVRIQQVSDDAMYSGVWFRGFDYEKWEAYGSDGDAGWGIWCVETGWTQAWISATLSLQVMNTNAWDYTKDSNIGDSFSTVAAKMLSVEIDEASPIPSYELSDKVTARGSVELLFDGEYGSTTYSDGKWFGAEGVDITVFVDYQRDMTFDTVKLHFLQNMKMGICVPGGITVYTSDDGVTYTLFGSAVGTTDIQTEYSNRSTDGAFFEYLEVASDKKVTARYIKIVVESAGEYIKSGNSTKHWIFMDELELHGGEADLESLKTLIDSVSALDLTGYQPAGVIALEEAYNNALKYYNSQTHDPAKFQSIYDALDTAINGLEAKRRYTTTEYVNFNKLVGKIDKLSDGNITSTTLQGKLITNLSSLTEQQLEVYLDLGSTVGIHQIGYAAESVPYSGKYLHDAEFFVSDSADGPWVSVGTLTAQKHNGSFKTSEYRVLGAEANGKAGRYVKVVFTRNADVEYTSSSNKIYRAEWLFLTEIFINEYVPVTVESEDASVSVKSSNGKELSMLGAFVGDTLTVTVSPDGSSISTVTVNGVEVNFDGNSFVISEVTSAQSIVVDCFTFSDEDRPTIVVKDWFITPGQNFDPLTDIYAYDKNGKDISSSVKVIENNIGTTAGTYTVTYYVADEAGAFVEATANVYVVNELVGTHVVAITPSTKDDLSKMAQRLVDGIYAPAGSTHAASQYVSWQDTDYVEIVLALSGNIGIADIGYSIIACPTYGFLPPDIDLYVADELGEWTKVATVDAVKHPYENNEYEYIKKYGALDNIKASYVKVVIRFDDDPEMLANYKYDPSWTFVDEIMINPYYSVTAGECENGTVTVTASSESGALYGESAAVTFTADDGYVLDGVSVNGVPVRVTGNTYTITEITKHTVIEASFTKMRIKSAVVNLTESIALIYYAILDDASDAEMIFTMNGKSVYVGAVATANANVYAFAFKNVAPQCMGDSVKAELTVGGVIIDTVEAFSVREYALATLADVENKAIAGYTDEQYAALATLIADMLEYGAAAQNYTGYKNGENDLVNEGVSGKSEFTELSDENDAIVGDSVSEELYFVSAGIRFDYVNYMYFKFNASVTDGIVVKVTNKTTGVVKEYAAEAYALVDGDVYILYTDAIAPTDFDTCYTVELCADGAVIQTIEYGISAYVHYIQEQSTAMAELARALYNYGTSARKYKELT